jgi:acyl-homoserine-lactone acylase
MTRLTSAFEYFGIILSAMKKILILLFLCSPCVAQKFNQAEVSQWTQQAKEITIVRDTWGIPHITGKTDADAVFGLLYAQCEDDFERVERNYIVATARLAEVEGEDFIYHDLRTRLFIDTTKAIELFKKSPDWLKKICVAFADGANYYLYTHPQVKSRLISRFQPWMPLLFSEGSIGGDIESISLNGIKEFYGNSAADIRQEVNNDGIELEPRGSNGFAISPTISANGHAMLLINPHTSFYFRSEVHIKSDEGLNAYGAVTWGQFFVYQGFNEHCGWMHTSSAADVIDDYRESVVRKGNGLFYKHGKELKPMSHEKVAIRFRKGNQTMKKEFTLYRTHHGPIVAKEKDKWISVSLMQDPVNALTQSYQRIKAKNFEEFRNVMALRTNSSNNTVYADDQGNIAYWHGDFMPKRDKKFNWDAPVDGSDLATDWKGLHELSEIVQLLNPPNGWIQNCNSTPFTAAGSNSPNQKDYPRYMAPDAENARGIHAVKVLSDQTGFTLDKLIAVSQDSYLPAFEGLIPSLIRAYDQESARIDSVKRLAEPMQLLRNWDLRYSATSVPTTLAIFWAQRLRQNSVKRIPANLDQLAVFEFLQKNTSAMEKLVALSQVTKSLENDFGNWQQPWGEINRFQRLEGKIEAKFDDRLASTAVPFTASAWGSLAAFGSRRFPGTKKLYGYSGNSFVAVVEFGPKVKARSVVTGGSSSNPLSKHFNDQSGMYCAGQFKEVLFYPEDFLAHNERSYHPGE